MASLFKVCSGCGERFDINSQPYAKHKTRYVHVDCFKEKYPDEELIIVEPKPVVKKESKPKRNLNERKCVYCGKYFDITKEEFSQPRQRQYAHQKCYNENYSEDEAFVEEIYDYLGNELLIKYDFVQCEKQRKTFIKKNGYTNEGILLALKYFYEVKKQSADRSGNRIGIVPYVYDEAQAYYSELKKRKKQINKGLAKQLDKKAVKIKIIGEEKVKEKDYIDLDSITEEGD